MASQGPPVPFATKPTYIQTFSTVGDAVTSPKGSSGILLPVSLGGLDALQNVLESVNTLPCIKYITGITIKLLQIVQSTNEAVRKIAMRAKDIVLAVARASANALEEVTGQLESDLQQLTETMNDILEFTQEISTRRTYQKLWNKAEDAAAVKSLDAQLSHAFQIFEIQSSVNLRLTQQMMVRQLSGISLSPPTRLPLSTTHPLRIPDGLYLIQNAANGRAVETEHWRPSPSYLHACVAPSKDGLSPYQIWFVSAKRHKETDYTIRNFATGASLDVYCGHTQDGTQVICQASHGMANQTWSLYGSRAADSYDYCTIRSHGPPTVLDGECPAGVVSHPGSTPRSSLRLAVTRPASLFYRPSS
ncbi:hypothetical protein PHLGIDRAFT_480310 [Phlebiopsis gigantea 11061_1 CR5-6]|uniref:Ricin B lectin domain-containing protein n=1 Tax=Phlebiopsis gigantea (strain 11061_1 CR5-6) TaxID=745531 RepID=A0A0C3S985_PHLG1|nr:hypothetical protein PHLGIDRAFT_480310 [Phlebiopsis gigantea 11061_1 CR5-6]